MPRPGPLGFSSPVVMASKPESESQPHLLWPFPDEEAEEFARRLTAKPSPIVADEIVELFKLLPKEKPPRGERSRMTDRLPSAPVLTAKGDLLASGPIPGIGHMRPRR